MSVPIDVSSYDYLRQMSFSTLAWEFLRRNLNYQRDWRLHRTVAPRFLTSGEGVTFRILHRRFRCAEAWGLRVFENPAADGRYAHPFWLPEIQARSIDATTTREVVADLTLLALPRIVGAQGALIDVDRTLHVAIDSGSSAFGLSIRKLVRPVGTFCLIFEIPAFSRLTKRFEAIAELERRVKNCDLRRPSDMMARSRLCECLSAVDGRRQGLSYRQIAEAVFGKRTVLEDWDGRSRFLKDRTRRLVEKGELLVAGGYRDLLR